MKMTVPKPCNLYLKDFFISNLAFLLLAFIDTEKTRNIAVFFCFSIEFPCALKRNKYSHLLRNIHSVF